MPVLCLVPTPLAAARAARRLCDAEGGVLFGPAVATLDRLVPGLLAASRDRRAVLTPLAERLLAAEAGSAAGGALAELSPGSGLAAALARTLGELRRGEVKASDLRAAAAGLEGASADRLVALAAALEAYEDRLAALRALDRAGAVRAAADAARRGISSAETAGLDLLVVDGLAAASAAEWDLLAALVSRARRTRVHLPYVPERADLSAPVEPLLRRLEALHDVAARAEVELLLPHVDEGRAPALAAVLAGWAGGAPHPAAAGPGGPLRVACGAGAAGEAEVVADLVADLVGSGLAPDDVAVIAPSPRALAPSLAAACAARDVALATGRGARLADVPVVRTVLEAVGAAGALGRTAAERLLGTSWFAPRGVGGLPALLERAGALEGRGRPAEALRRRAAALAGGPAASERAALAAAAEAIETLDALLAPLARPALPRTLAAALRALLDRSGLRRRAARGPREVAAADLGALARLEEAADAVVRAAALCGRAEAPLAPELFRVLLGIAVDEAALPPGAEPAAGAVELWALDEAPALSARAVIVAGCSRGAFPAAPGPEPLLREPERAALNRHLRRQAVAPTAARRAEAAHRAFSAAVAAREVLAFTWAAPGPAGDGGPLAPLAAEALAAGGVVPPAGPAPAPGLGDARTTRAALRAVARAGGAAALPPPLSARAGDAAERGAIEVARREAVLAGAAAPFAGAVEGPALEALRAALPEEWTASQLEAHASCPFRAFLQLGARLSDRDAADLEIDARDEGTLVHAALERFVRGRMARRAWPPAGGPEDLAEVDAATTAVFGRFEREGRTGDPAVWAAKRDAVRARLARMVVADARDHDGLVPVAVEHRFGGDGPEPALALTADGETVRLRGRVDRIDADGDRLLVLDYKNAKHGREYAALLGDDALAVRNFQIPVYLAVAARAYPGRTRLEATYALVRKGERVKPFAVDAGDPLVAPEAPAGPDAPRSLAAAVVDATRRIRAGTFPIASRSCDYCPFGAVCRFQGAAEQDEEAAP